MEIRSFFVHIPQHDLLVLWHWWLATQKSCSSNQAFLELIWHDINVSSDEITLPSPVKTKMDEHLQVHKVYNQPLRTTQPFTLSGTGNKCCQRGSARWPGRQSSLALHWTHITDLWAQWPKEGKWAPQLHSCIEYGTYNLPHITITAK